MLLETAHVVALESDSVWVETIRRSSCGSCAAKKGCGHSLLEQVGAGRRNYIRVFSGELSAAECSVDDHVRISIPEQVIVRGSLLVYILPLLTMLAGASFATALAVGSADLAAVIGAAGGFAIGIGLVRLHSWYHRDDKSMQPSLVALVNSEVEIVQVT